MIWSPSLGTFQAVSKHSKQFGNFWEVDWSTEPIKDPGHLNWSDIPRWRGPTKKGRWLHCVWHLSGTHFLDFSPLCVVKGGCTLCGIYPEHILWTFLHSGTACGIHRGSLGIGRLNLVESSVGNPLNLADTLHILPVATLSPSWGL